jgi:hypothetical protein
MNGEIGYIAVAEAPPMVMAPTPDLTMSHLHTSTLVSPAHLAMGPPEHSAELQKTGFRCFCEPTCGLHCKSLRS